MVKTKDKISSSAAGAARNKLIPALFCHNRVLFAQIPFFFFSCTFYHNKFQKLE